MDLKNRFKHEMAVLVEREWRYLEYSLVDKSYENFVRRRIHLFSDDALSYMVNPDNNVVSWLRDAALNQLTERNLLTHTV